MKYKITTQYLTKLKRWQPLFNKQVSGGEAVVFSEPTEFVDNFPTQEEAHKFAIEQLKLRGANEEDIEVEPLKNDD